MSGMGAMCPDNRENRQGADADTGILLFRQNASCRQEGPPVRYAGLHSRYRAVALQILYEYETTSHTPSRIINAHFHILRQEGIAFSVVGQDFIRQFVNGVLETREQLDGCIAQGARRYPVWTLSVIDRTILRLALFEHTAQVFASPVKVIIAEAIALAEHYGSDVSPRFVHGVLGTILNRQPTQAVSA